MTPNQEISLAVKALKIGNKVRELRQKNRFTLQDLAAKPGLSPFLSQSKMTMWCLRGHFG